MKGYSEWKGLKIGSFTGGSNISGLCLDMDRISDILHRNNVLAIFDCAGVGPYIELRMNGPSDLFPPLPDSTFVYKDAMFVSIHKLPGGPLAPGLLLAKRNLFQKVCPFLPGGGTIFHVGFDSHSFTTNIEEREEGGTPNILGSIKAGLAFQLKKAVGEKWISHHELDTNALVNTELSKVPNLVLIGNHKLLSLPIYAFNIKAHGKFLHPNFVTKLLNDLFGIQARGGCSCAVLYGQTLMGISPELSQKYNDLLFQGFEIMRIGYARINFNYFVSQGIYITYIYIIYIYIYIHIYIYIF